jgi:hypothetical protein
MKQKQIRCISPQAQAVGKSEFYCGPPIDLPTLPRGRPEAGRFAPGAGPPMNHAVLFVNLS